MPRVVAKIADLGLLIVATYSVLWLIQPKPDLVYSSILDKQQRLINIATPRPIFVDGSGVALCLDSKLIETQVRLFDLPGHC